MIDLSKNVVTYQFDQDHGGREAGSIFYNNVLVVIADPSLHNQVKKTVRDVIKFNYTTGDFTYRIVRDTPEAVTDALNAIDGVVSFYSNPDIYYNSYSGYDDEDDDEDFDDENTLDSGSVEELPHEKAGTEGETEDDLNTEDEEPIDAMTREIADMLGIPLEDLKGLSTNERHRAMGEGIRRDLGLKPGESVSIPPAFKGLTNNVPEEDDMWMPEDDYWR